MDKGAIVERGTLDELLEAEAPVLCSLMATYSANKKAVKAFAESAADSNDPAAASLAADSSSEALNTPAEVAASETDEDAGAGGVESNELTGQEDRAEGGVKAGPIWKYLVAAGIPHSFGMLAAFSLDVGLQAISTYWLVWWGVNRFSKRTSWYMLGLAGISLSEVLLAIDETVILPTLPLHRY